MTPTAFGFTSPKALYGGLFPPTDRQAEYADDLCSGIEPGFGMMVLTRILDNTTFEGRPLSDSQRRSAMAYSFVIDFLTTPGPHIAALRQSIGGSK